MKTQSYLVMFMDTDDVTPTFTQIEASSPEYAVIDAMTKIAEEWNVSREEIHILNVIGLDLTVYDTDKGYPFPQHETL